jgi:hypothetical protein
MSAHGGGHHEQPSHGHGDEDSVIDWLGVNEFADALNPEKLADAISDVIPGYSEAVGSYQAMLDTTTGGIGASKSDGGHKTGGHDDHHPAAH